MKNQLSICTIFSKNYLPFVRNLTESFLKHNPDSKVFALLVDKLDGFFDPQKEKFELVSVYDLGMKDLESLAFKYSVIELNTAVKPRFFKYLYDKYPNIQKLCYLDPDISFYGPLNEVNDLLDDFNFVLTPHITKPLEFDGFCPSELDFLKAGAYNLGFLGTRRNDEVFQMLNWWDERLYEYAANSFESELFTDQKWISLVPGLFSKAFVLRDPGYNLAYWNLQERKKITKIDEQYYVNDEPLYFLHFSGLMLNNIELISKYQNRFKLSDFNEILRELFEDYRDQIFKHDYWNCRNCKYAFGLFDNGVAVSDFFRKIYLQRKELQDSFKNPFSTDGDNFLKWLTGPARQGSYVTNLLELVYLSRGDLLKVYPDIWGKDQLGLMTWGVNHMPSEYEFDRYFPEDLEKKFFDLNDYLNKSNDTGTGKEKLNQESVSILKRIFDYRPFRSLKNALEKRDGNFDHYENFGVNIIGYIDSESGVGEGARGIIRSIENAKIPFSLINLVDEMVRKKDNTYKDFSNNLQYPVNIMVVNADTVRCLVRNLGHEKFEGKYNIGFWAWELETFPKKWLTSFKHVNEVWTMSNYCLKSISAVSPVPVVNLPIPIEFKPDNKYDRDYFRLNKEQFIFLNCFDGFSFIERKNPFKSAEAFAKAFKGRDDVLLILKCHNVKSKDVKRLEEILKNTNHRIIPEYLDREIVLGLLNCCDCYLALHSSEGFGYMIGEALYLGKHVIVTGYSGNLDFTTINNSELVRFNLVELESDVGPYEVGNKWADADIDDAVNKMLRVFKERKSKPVNVAGQQFMQEFYSKEAISRKMTDRLLLIERIIKNKQYKNLGGQILIKKS